MPRVDVVIIKCSHCSNELQLSEQEGLRRPDGSEYYRVTISGQGLLASLQVYAFDPHGSLDQFFAALVANWRGWKGEKKWASLEGEFSLVCTSDSVGRVAIEVILNSRLGGDGWSAQNIIHVDAGQLEQIALDAKKFFALQAAI
jgi:hypothetical protein